MSISVVVRPPLFCAACGSAMQIIVVGTTGREVWCINGGCPQYNERGLIEDPVITHLSPGVLASMVHATSINTQREH